MGSALSVGAGGSVSPSELTPSPPSPLSAVLLGWSCPFSDTSKSTFTVWPTLSTTGTRITSTPALVFWVVALKCSV